MGVALAALKLRRSALSATWKRFLAWSGDTSGQNTSRRTSRVQGRARWVSRYLNRASPRGLSQASTRRSAMVTLKLPNRRTLTVGPPWRPLAGEVEPEPLDLSHAPADAAGW